MTMPMEFDGTIHTVYRRDPREAHLMELCNVKTVLSHRFSAMLFIRNRAQFVTINRSTGCGITGGLASSTLSSALADGPAGPEDGGVDAAASGFAMKDRFSEC